jgi:hypothetical protein
MSPKRPLRRDSGAFWVRKNPELCVPSFCPLGDLRNLGVKVILLLLHMVQALYWTLEVSGG